MKAKQMRKFAGFFLGFILSLGLAGGLAGCGSSNASGQFSPPPGGGVSTAEYLFASANGQVMAYSVDASTGALGTPAAVSGTAHGSIGVLADPAGKFLYVSDPDTDSVHVFSIASNGGLAEITGSPYALGGGSGSTASGLAMNSAGTYLYALDYTNYAVTTFSVNSSSGALTAVGSPVSTQPSQPSTVGSEPFMAVVDPSNQFLYTSDSTDPNGGISAFTIDHTTGALTFVPGAPFATTSNARPIGLAIHPNGKFLYVAASAAGKIFSETVNNTGTLTTLGSSTSAGSIPTGVVMDPSGKYLYAANYGDGTISGYSVDANSGALTEMTGSPFTTTALPLILAVDPAGKFLYATNPNTSVITGFTINSNGTLTQFSGSAAAAGNQPVALTVVAVPQ